jgi:hypothetical protein
MKRFRTIRNIGVLSGAALVLAALAARAEGPLSVGGLPPYVEGVPFRWNVNPLTYWTDPGPATGAALGNQTAQQADDLVTQAFQVWQDVPTANINFSFAGKLGADVTSSNYMGFENDLFDCNNPVGPIAQERSIVYDVDGSIVTALGDDPNSLLGFASPACYDSNGSENFYTRGVALLNGMWIDGQPDSLTNGEITLAEFRAVFIHEFGHLIGLDHSQINVNCLPAGNCSTADIQGLPTMFPLLFGEEQASLTQDDTAGVSELYPETLNNPPTQVPFLSTTGRIRGRIFFSDTETPAGALNVIARRVADPRRIAVSSVPGFLFTADAGNPVIPFPWPGSPFGSRDPTLIGFYEMPGLSPGDYTIEVEAIDPEFVEGSSVGPIAGYGIQFPLPGNCTLEFANTTPPESNTDSCNDQTTFNVTAGTTFNSGTDIILNGTPPRFDAWEDE